MLDPYRWIPGETHDQRNERKASELKERSDANRKAASLHRRLSEGHGRYLFGLRPRCGQCGSLELKTYRTDTTGGTIARHIECRGCGVKFVLVLE